MKLAPGQVAVVTGAASGIGFALAEELAARGLRVVLADVQAEPLHDACDRLATDGAEALAVVTDVRDAAAVDALAASTLDRFGRVDLICNNAGVSGPAGPMWEQDLEVWRWVLGVGLMGVVHGVRSFVPHLVAQGHGHVLNTASVGGLIPLPTRAPYNAAKHAVVGLSETLHEELRVLAPGVGVTVLCPGLVATGLAETSARNRPATVTARGDVDRSAADRARFGAVLQPQEIARAALVGVEDGQLHVLTNADVDPIVRARAERLLTALDRA